MYRKTGHGAVVLRPLLSDKVISEESVVFLKYS